MKEKFSKIPESLFKDDRFTPQEKIIAGFRLGMAGNGYWTYKANTVAELFGVHRTTVMNTYRKMKQYGFLEEVQDNQTVMKSIIKESGSLFMCSETTTPSVVAALQGCSEMTTPTPPILPMKNENHNRIIMNYKEDIMNSKEKLTEQLKTKVITYANVKLNMDTEVVYNKTKMNSDFVYYKSKGSNDWVGLSKTNFVIAYKKYKTENL